MDNVVDAIPFEGECCFHLILHHIHHVTWLSSTFTPPTQIVNQSLNTYLIFCNHARLNLRIQHLIYAMFLVGQSSTSLIRSRTAPGVSYDRCELIANLKFQI